MRRDICPRRNLLLVEDDSALAELVRWHFEREEFDVQHTGDGERSAFDGQGTHA